MGDRVTYELADGIATITVDDGKVNALPPSMLGEIGAAFEQAQTDGAAVVLTGRDGVFSGGFDLGILRGGGRAMAALCRAGFELAHRVLSFPAPVVVACSGHAIAMGAFLVLSGDHRVGVAGGGHRVHANEVMLGVTMPRSAIVLCRQRLTPAAFEQAVVLARPFSHDEAVAAGFLDEVVPAGDLGRVARERAMALAQLEPSALTSTKLRARAKTIDDLRAAIEADDVELLAAV